MINVYSFSTPGLALHLLIFLSSFYPRLGIPAPIADVGPKNRSGHRSDSAGSFSDGLRFGCSFPGC